LAFVLGGALVACSLLVPLDEQQCSADGDCAGRGAGFADTTCVNHLCVATGIDASVDTGADGPGDAADASSNDAGPWSCLGQPPQIPDPKARVAITLTLFDALKPITTAGAQGGTDLQVISYTPASGISLEACNVLDPQCASPVTPLVVSDDAGVAHVNVPGDFAGFFRLSGAGYLPSALYPGPVLADASTGSVPTAMLKKNDTQLLAVAIGVPLETDPDAGVGHAFFQVFDCFDRQAPGVVFTLDVDGGSQTVQWYTKNDLPSTTAKETDTLGAGGAVNVPAGALTVTATLAATKQTLGTVNTVITAGGTTFAWVRVRTRTN
jgi:hypothetical protein